MIKFGIVRAYRNKIQKMYKSHDTPTDFCWHQKLTFWSYREMRLKVAFWYIFLILLTYIESLKIALIKRIGILMMSAKSVTPGLLKIKVYWNKSCDVIISVHYISNKILPRDSDYIIEWGHERGYHILGSSLLIWNWH